MTRKRVVALFLACMFSVMTLFSSQQVIYAFGVESEQRKEGECCPQTCLLINNGFTAHLNMYYELLAEKYTPQYVDTWREISREQAVLKKKISEAMKNGQLMHGEVIDQEWYKKHEELQTLFVQAVEQRNEKAIKKVLPKVFQQQKDLNKMYKERLAMIN
ncbi:hypothetical protein [Alkalihalobacterium elongatum]|uniref:hypothetical protein n=1 Tax=Alkalihalobacterium elongatum TaxID=2675466 RepID=UPI001C1F638D|nr:hypothetical protein [Alkalihalobacterium elongatum]